MGSFYHPRLYEPDMANVIREAFYDMWETVEGNVGSLSPMADDELKAAIIKTLFELVSQGRTTRADLSEDVLRSFKLGSIGAS